MAYAEPQDVRARAGVLAAGFNQGSVGDTEIERFLDDVSAEIDAVLAAQGAATPITDPTVLGALRGLNADGALLLAVRAKYPSTSASSEVGALLTDLQRRWDAWIAAVANGTSIIITLLQSENAVGTGASNFWSTNPGYGQPGDASTDPYAVNPYLAPTFARTDRF